MSQCLNSKKTYEDFDTVSVAEFDVWDPCFIKGPEFGKTISRHTLFDQEKVAFLFRKKHFKLVP